MSVRNDNRPKMAVLVAGAILALLGLFAIIGLNNGLIVTTYQIESEKITQSTRIMVLTDLHSEMYGEDQSEITAKIERQNPDIILMSGDIADDRTPHDATIRLLESIAARYPCYYVTGNHEFWSGEVEEIKDMFRRYGVHVLEGEHASVEVSGQVINICGIDDPEVGEPAYEQQLRNAFSGINSSNYTILLSHRPERFIQNAAYDCDLIVSGHAHGGQVRIPFFIDGVYAPDQGLFPEYTGGVYSMDDKLMLVSRGLSREIYVLPRIYNPPEVVVIEIVPTTH